MPFRLSDRLTRFGGRTNHPSFEPNSFPKMRQTTTEECGQHLGKGGRLAGTRWSHFHLHSEERNGRIPVLFWQSVAGRKRGLHQRGRPQLHQGEDPLIYGMRITRHATCPDIGISVSNRPRYPTIPPEDREDPYYSPVPNDPYWYQKENDDDTKESNKKSPTRSTKEEEHHNIASSLTVNSASLIVLSVSILLSWRWVDK
ncbi:uncharacterized protein CDAR_545911 [Caerostris darwini]|uniref:Uncharacterized protein n=1 Tax=Caerostris darwini TaxID=1538125 RepID=A0AAV4X387_9ARAC|nr:uncharacterized protein CDAR_545911 [Caerostris darwini]